MSKSSKKTAGSKAVKVTKSVQPVKRTPAALKVVSVSDKSKAPAGKKVAATATPDKRPSGQAGTAAVDPKHGKASKAPKTAATTRPEPADIMAPKFPRSEGADLPIPAGYEPHNADPKHHLEAVDNKEYPAVWRTFARKTVECLLHCNAATVGDLSANQGFFGVTVKTILESGIMTDGNWIFRPATAAEKAQAKKYLPLLNEQEAEQRDGGAACVTMNQSRPTTDLVRGPDVVQPADTVYATFADPTGRRWITPVAAISAMFRGLDVKAPTYRQTDLVDVVAVFDGKKEIGRIIVDQFDPTWPAAVATIEYLDSLRPVAAGKRRKAG